MTGPNPQRTFSLTMTQVPAPPESTAWIDILRWMICVMDRDDGRLSFVAGCLSHSLRYGGLSDRQHNVCEPIFHRVVDDWRAGVLICQNVLPDEIGTTDPVVIGRMN